MSNLLTPDLCVIGAGSGGLYVAAGAVQMGASVVLIERAKMGGDCLNYGCVPSKSLLAAAHRAVLGRHAASFGVTYTKPEIEFEKTHKHIHDVIKSIAPHDSQERFEALGVKVIRDEASFVSKTQVKAGDYLITPRRCVIATGSSPLVPDIPGLADVAYHTNETIFDLTARPDHLLIVGGGPIGIEMAHAFAGLGAQVSLVQRGRILPKDDTELVSMLRDILVKQGIVFHENAAARCVRKSKAGIELELDNEKTIKGTHLLIAAGRAPNLDSLNLSAAGISYQKTGIEIDARLRTSNKKIYAIGDIAQGPKFTHVAGYHASIVIRNVLFCLPAKLDYSALPWVTYCAPELAQVGMTEEQAINRRLDHKIIQSDFADNDRARAEQMTQGRLKLVVSPKGRVLGASILGDGAGEMAAFWGLVISQKIKLNKVASLIVPYPSMSEIAKRAAGTFYTDKLYGRFTKKIVKFLARFG